MIAAALLVFGCSGRKVDMDSATPPESAKHSDETRDPKDVKIETLTSSLSRAQSRIEELDAKVSALSDKVDATRLAVDNVAGSKPLKTEAVGSAKADKVSGDEDSGPVPVEHAGSVRNNSNNLKESKSVGQMDAAISEFNKAMAIFKLGKYADSELAFNHFTERYPEHVLAGSAQFYAGESYFSMSEYKLALNEYNKVVSSFASSPRVASAMVRMAHCYDAVGNTTESTRTMALAKELFEGNPSLDWPAPSHAAPVRAKPDPLKAGPMEPAPKPHDSSKEKNDE